MSLASLRLRSPWRITVNRSGRRGDTDFARLEIAHVLFIDIVSYSKLSIDQQQAAIDKLAQLVRATDQFQKADATDRLGTPFSPRRALMACARVS